MNFGKLCVATTLVCCAISSQTLAQPLQMTNVIPDGGNYAAKGKIETINSDHSSLVLKSEDGQQIPMNVASNVNLSGIAVGDIANIHYTQYVTFVIGSLNVPIRQILATSTIDDVMHTPGGVGHNPALLLGRVVKINDSSSFNIVNADGGGIYTITSTEPTRQVAINMLKVGDSITVSVSSIIATSVTKCGPFGRGMFGCYQ